MSGRDYTQAYIDLAFCEALLAATGKSLREWQRWTILRARSRHPVTGQLPRHYVCLVPRRAGKTEVISALATMVLLTQPPTGAQLSVLNVAYSLLSADVLASRMRQIVTAPAAAARLKASTETRGIRLLEKHGGHTAKTLVSSEKAANSHGGFLIIDELHLIGEDALSNLLVSSSVVPGRTVQMADGPRYIENDPAVVSISTQGDESSTALAKTLTAAREQANDPDASVFYSYWRSPRADVTRGDDDFEECLIAANPSIREGALSAADAIRDAALLTDELAIRRYLLNLPVDSTQVIDPYIDDDTWAAVPPIPMGVTPGPQGCLGIDINAARDRIAIALAWRDSDGTVSVAHLATIESPNMEAVTEQCLNIAGRFACASVILDPMRLPGIEQVMHSKHRPVVKYTPKLGTIFPAAVARAVNEGGLRASHSPEVTRQISHLAPKRTSAAPDEYRLIPRTPGQPITVAMAMVMAAGAMLDQANPGIVPIY